MKTTIDIANSLLLTGKKIAKQQNTTLRALIEEGLNLVITRRSEQKPHKFKPVTFKGKGISPEFAEESWGSIRNALYKGRGS